MKTKQPIAEHRVKCLVCSCYCRKQDMCQFDPDLCKLCDTKLARQGLRRCRLGGEIKEIKFFRVLRSGSRRRICHSCFNKRDRATHYDARLARDREYNDSHQRHRLSKEHRNAVRRAWLKRTGKNAEITRRWRSRHHDQYLALSRRWRDNNREHKRAQDRESQKRRRLQRLIKILRNEQ